MIAFPLGGVGAGTISLGGRGQLRDWEIFNRPDKGNSPSYAFASMWAKIAGRPPAAAVLEARLTPPYEGSSGLGARNAPGLPRLDSAVFTGSYPMARVDFRDTRLPVQVSLEAFTPFFPLDAEESGLPVAVLRYRVANSTASKARVGVAFSLDNPVGTQGRMNDWRQDGALAGLFMRNPFLDTGDPLAGSFAVCVMSSGGGKLTHWTGWPRSGRNWTGPLLFWDDFAADGELDAAAEGKDTPGSVCLTRDIAARSHSSFTFLLAWHFPNRTPERCGWRAAKGEEKTVVGNHYAKRFRDAWDAAAYASMNLEKLEKRTREFVAAIRESTLPAAVKDAATANLSTYASQTCFRTADGAFHAFEGCNDQRGCCFGNCTHVWNYDAATPHVFPALSRSLREAAFGFSTDSEGRMDFRQILPQDKERWGNAAADGQMGAIMKLYLDWKISGDTAWLRTHWPAARRALEFTWIPGGWDADRNGVMEGSQHNTYDVEFFGPNPLCGVWYLGALRAAEEMARALSDDAFAGACHDIFERGSRWIDANLFNGDYYYQKIQGMPREAIAKGLIAAGFGIGDPQNPDCQAGEGCLADQLVGQYLARIAGLGDLLDLKQMRKALESIYKYNFRANLMNHASVERVYALNDDSALLICDYGHGKRPRIPFPYFSEAWTGIEYSTAALMIWEGMVDEGLRIVEAVRRRHDGERRNPWNEPECGHHYARALSSWAPLLALSGWSYDAPARTVRATPRLAQAEFRSFWSAGSGWGTFTQRTSEKQFQFILDVGFGAVSMNRVILPETRFEPGKSTTSLGKTAREHALKRADGSTVIEFASEVGLKEGDRLTIEVSGTA